VIALAAKDIVVKSAEGTPVKGVSLTLPLGAILTILGESGSGKSLLAKAIMGALPDSLTATGSVEVMGVASPAADGPVRRPLWGRKLSLLPQEPWLALDPTMRVQEQVAEVHALVKGESWADARKSGARALNAAGLSHAAQLFPHVLSGGMAQRVTLAATRAGGAPLLIADEPTKGLDAALRDNVLIDLRQIAQTGGSVLTITHDVHAARVLGGRLAVMLAGEIVEEGEAREVLESPRHPYTRALLDADPAAWPTAPAQSQAAPVITAKGLTKSYDGRVLFSGIGLTVGRGERLAIAGPSGAGKSTFGNVLLGLRKPDAGTIACAAGLKPVAFQKLYQDPIAAFPPAASLRQILDDLVRLHRLNWADAVRMMETLRLDPRLLDRLPSQISSGELQRFAVVRVLLLKPALIFADEPTSRLDPIGQKQTFDLLLQAAASTGCALLVVTHNPDIARATGGRILRIGEAEAKAA
jgi:peptide/nickel transport system ATP-binding protein